jgi:hypothetical protein
VEIDLVYFYVNFLERELRIYPSKAKRVDVTVLNSHEHLKEYFEKCALVATLPPSMLKSLRNKKT